MLRALILGLIFLQVTESIGDTIEFTVDELAKESVLPVFESVQVIKNRRVTMAKRFEFGAATGMNLTEALYNKLNYTVQGSYHFDEIHGVNVFGLFMFDGLSAMGEDLKAGKGLTGGLKFDASLAPHPKSFYFVNYEYTAYYGKISITKDFDMSISLYGIGGLGMVDFGSVTGFGANIGLGQKFYFTPNLAFRFDLRFVAYPGPDPTSKDNLSGTVKPDPSEFSETTYMHTFMTVGLSWLM